MLTVGIILAVLIFIGFLRLSVTVEYSGDGITALAKFGFIRIFSYPSNKKRKPEKSKEDRKKRKKSGKGGGEKKKPSLREQFGGSFQMIKKLLPAIFKVLNKFRKKLIIRELTLYYTVACDDPYDTAMRYGELSAGLPVLYNMLAGFFKIKKSELQTFFDFSITEPVVYMKAKFSLSVGRILGIVLTAGTSLLKVIAENNNGKAVK